MDWDIIDGWMERIIKEISSMIREMDRGF